jgi:hypothetical protein
MLRILIHEGVLILSNVNVRHEHEGQTTAFFSGPEDRSISIRMLLQRFEDTGIEDERLLTLAVHAYDSGHYIRSASLFDQFPPSSPLYALAKLGGALSHLSQAVGVSRSWRTTDSQDQHNHNKISNLEAIEHKLRQLIAKQRGGRS